MSLEICGRRVENAEAGVNEMKTQKQGRMRGNVRAGSSEMRCRSMNERNEIVDMEAEKMNLEIFE